MVLTKSQIQKLAAEVLQRYEEKYGALRVPSPKISLSGNTTRTNMGKGSIFKIGPGTDNPMGIKPPAGQAMSPSALGGKGVRAGTGVGGKRV